MFDLEKREKLIILVLLTALLIGIAFGHYQKRAVHVDVETGWFIPAAEDTPSGISKININEADLPGLMKLKGIGEVLAGRIIEHRSMNGSFRSIEELKKVKGLGDKLYENIKSEVSID